MSPPLQNQAMYGDFMSSLAVSQDIIVYFRNGTPFIINTRNKEEFEITDPELLSSLISYLNNGSISDATLDILTTNNILVPQSQKPLFRNFENDFLDLFHQGAVDVLADISVLSPLEYADLYLRSSVRVAGMAPPQRRKDARTQGRIFR